MPTQTQGGSVTHTRGRKVGHHFTFLSTKLFSTINQSLLHRQLVDVNTTSLHVLVNGTFLVLQRDLQLQRCHNRPEPLPPLFAPLNEDLIECSNALGSWQTERILFKISPFRLIKEWRGVIMNFLFRIATKLRSKKLLVEKRLAVRLELLKT